MIKDQPNKGVVKRNPEYRTPLKLSQYAGHISYSIKILKHFLFSFVTICRYINIAFFHYI